MRITAQRDHPAARDAKVVEVGWGVMLNGELVPNVIVADDEEGWVVAFDPSDNGGPHASRVNGEPLQVVLRGEVELVPPDGA